MCEGTNGSLLDLNDSPSIDGSGESPGQLIARPEISASNATLTENSLPSLTLEQVKDAWENVKKRVRPKNPKTAAMLNSFTVVGVEGTAEEAVVVIQAPTASVVRTPTEDSSSPVVKNSVVRENTTIESSTSSPEALRQKVSSDPVVQEVMKTFTAKIVDIRTK